MENIEAEDFITVIDWVLGRDQSYKGDLFKVYAIDKNLYLVERITGPRFGSGYMILDTNKVNIRKVPEDFIQNCLNTGMVLRPKKFSEQEAMKAHILEVSNDSIREKLQPQVTSLVKQATA